MFAFLKRDHMPILGHIIDSVSDTDNDSFDLNNRYDKDITIEEDIWYKLMLPFNNA